jgi:hypothetical protein
MSILEIQNEIQTRALAAGYSVNLHESMGGSVYQQIKPEFDFPVLHNECDEGSYTIRYADHDNVSRLPGKGRADWMFLAGKEEEWSAILDSVNFSDLLRWQLVKKTVLAKLLGVTVPALKKRLSPDSYDYVVENSNYPNSPTQVVNLDLAIKDLGLDAQEFAAKHAVARSTRSIYEVPEEY